MDLNPIRTAAVALIEALDAVESQPSPPEADPFAPPSGSEIIAFAEAHGLTVEEVKGWDGVGPNTAQKPLAALPDFPATTYGSSGAFTVHAPSRAEAIEYWRHGYGPDGLRKIWRAVDLKAARDLCTAIHQATSLEELEALLPGCGAGYMNDDARKAAVMQGLFPSLGHPVPKIAPDESGILGSVAGEQAVTIEDVILYSSMPAPKPWA